MRKLLVGIVVVVVLGGVADTAIRTVVDSQVASKVKSESGAASASASIGSLPFVLPLALQGKVSGGTVTARQVPIGPVVVDMIRLHAKAIRLDRAQLATGKVRVESIASATVTVRVTPSDISRVVGSAVKFASGGEGRLLATVAGISVPVTATIGAGETLLIEAAGRRLLEIPLLSSRLVPTCEPQVTVSASAVTASCTVSPVPPVLVSMFSSR